MGRMELDNEKNPQLQVAKKRHQRFFLNRSQNIESNSVIDCFEHV